MASVTAGIALIPRARLHTPSDPATAPPSSAAAMLVDMLTDASFYLFATIGLLLILRRPRNRMGPITLMVGLIGGLNTLTGNYALTALQSPAGMDQPAFQLAAWMTHWVYLAGILVGLVVIPFLFPDGSPQSPGWRAVARVAIVAAATTVLLLAFAPMPVGSYLAAMDIMNPLGLDWLTPWARAALTVGATLVAAGSLFVPPAERNTAAVNMSSAVRRRMAGVTALLIAAAILEAALEIDDLVLVVALALAVTALVVRWRTSSGDERRQIQWLIFAFGLSIVCAVLWQMTGGDYDPLSALFYYGFVLSWIGLAVAVGLALFKYRLYDIDLILNRTLVYGTLTGVTVALYVLIVSGLGVLLQNANDFGVSLTATGVIAVIFQPLRARLQRAVNRLLYGERDDPVGVLTRLAGRLERADSSPDVLVMLADTIGSALKLPYVAIWAQQDDGDMRPVAETGDYPDHVEVIPLLHQGENVGRLIVAPRGPGESFSPEDMRFLGGVVPLTTTTVRSWQLSQQVQTARARVVSAREEERRRLRRDLHDGLGPVLASQGLKLAAARQLLRRDPATAERLLEDVIDQSQTTVTEVRRLVYALRPPTLDELGLIEALHEHVLNLGAAGGAHITVHAPDELPFVPAAVEVAAFRVVQEALNNVIRHADASNATVTLAVDGYELLIRVDDDGTGLPDDLQPGIGLSSMRERAEEIGGAFAIGSSPSGGVSLQVRLPLSTI